MSILDGWMDGWYSTGARVWPWQQRRRRVSIKCFHFFCARCFIFNSMRIETESNCAQNRNACNVIALLFKFASFDSIFIWWINIPGSPPPRNYSHFHFKQVLLITWWVRFCAFFLLLCVTVAIAGCCYFASAIYLCLFDVARERVTQFRICVWSQFMMSKCYRKSRHRMYGGRACVYLHRAPFVCPA